MHIDMELYRVFYITAKHGSLSKAAQELYISQPAVTQAIKQLEEKLGGQLFFRTPKGVRLTVDGETLLPFVEQAYHLIQAGERKIAELHNLVSGEMKLSAGDTLCKHFLLPRLEAFHERYPGIKIQVTNRTTPETIKLLKEGSVDLGIVDLPLEEPQLDIRKGPTLQDTFITGAKYRELADRPSVPLSELAGYPLILLETRSNTRRYIDACAKEQGVAIKPEIELGSADLLVDFAHSGLGITCVVKEFVGPQLDGETLFEIPLEKPLPPRNVGIATLKGVPLSPATERFIREMELA